MINNFNQNIKLVTEKDGEVIAVVRSKESINIRSQLQAENDKFFSIAQEIKGAFLRMMLESSDKIADALQSSPKSLIALMRMIKYLQYNTNYLMKGEKKFGCNDLAKEMGITKQMASLHLQNLKKANILGEIKTRYGMRYVINPNIIGYGTKFPKNVIELFGDKNKK